MIRPLIHRLRRPRAERLALVLSVAANLAVAAYLLVAEPARPFGRDMAPRAARLVEMISNRPPPAEGARLTALYAARQPAMAAEDMAFRQAMIAVMTEIEKPEVDRAALHAAFNEARSIRSRSADLVIDIFVETLADASLEARQQIVAEIRGAR